MVTSINDLLNQALSYGKGGTVGGAASLPVQARADSYPSNSNHATTADSLDLSDASKVLRDLGVDLKSNTITQQAMMFDFNMQFTDEQINNISANGSYEYHSQSLKVDFSFLSAMTITDPETGEERKELFKFDFHLEANQFQAISNNQSVEKEDILDFARKILQKIAKLHSEGKSIDGLVLSQEDLKDLIGVDGGKLLKSIMLIIDLMRHTDRMLGKDGDHVLLNPERWKALVTNEQKQEGQSISMSMTVQQVSLESAQAVSAEAPQMEQAAPETPAPEASDA